jgi:undecaprenyl-diphosphatase
MTDSLLEGLVLGVVQGLTEFLPVSSSAHLKIIPVLLGWQDPGAAFSAVIQLGTTAALLVFFWRDLWLLAAAGTLALLRRDFADRNARLALGIALGTLPIVVAGVVLKKHIEGSFRSLWVIAGCLILFSVLLWLADRMARRPRRETETMDLSDALVVGVFQTLALVPGASRSGVTLTGALVLGFDRAAAARFSFLLSVPAVAGAGFYELWQERQHLLSGAQLPAMVTATLTSAVVGYLAIAAMLRFLRTRTALVFVVYRILLAFLLMALLAGGVLAP